MGRTPWSAEDHLAVIIVVVDNNNGVRRRAWRRAEGTISGNCARCLAGALGECGIVLEAPYEPSSFGEPVAVV